MLSRYAAVLLTALATACALADQYWMDWEGDDWPENQGWSRVWGNYDGLYHGSGANRTLHDSVLTYDSLYDVGVYDFSKMYRPGQMDPDPGELFVMQWRLMVSDVVGDYDPGVALFSDDAWGADFLYSHDHVRNEIEGVSIPIEPDVYHDYQFVSADMRNYDFYIDGAIARHGQLVHLVSQSYVAWGDGVQGAASVHDWDYFRFGVVPEPAMFASIIVIYGCIVCRR